MTILPPTHHKKWQRFGLYLCLFCLTFFLIVTNLLGLFLPNLPLGASSVIAKETPTTENPEAAEKEESDSKNKEKSFEDVIKDSEKITGLFTLYRKRKTNKVFLEIKPEQINQKFLLFITLDSGIGESPLVGGLPLEDLLFQFRKQEKTIEFVVPNINFRVNPEDPQARTLAKSFSDSVIASLPITATQAKTQSVLVDLGQLITGEENISSLPVLLSFFLEGSYSVNSDRSSFGQVKAFPNNVEIAYTYNFSDNKSIFPIMPSLADNRAFDLTVRYSLSTLPENNGYRPRLADERVGYFITAYKNISDQDNRTPFVRYINRWNLQKQNPAAALSLPVEPIVFWIENNVPKPYREAIEKGVLSWNKAFEKAGFINAIQVKQMPDNADWDPADIRYNTIRWSNTFESVFAGFGPTRLNPVTGQVLDADVVIDGNIVRNMKNEFRSLVEHNQKLANSWQLPTGESYQPCQLGRVLAKPSLPNQANPNVRPQSNLPFLPLLQTRYYQPGKSKIADLINGSDFCFALEASQQLALGSLAINLSQSRSVSVAAESEKYAAQFLQYLIAHEVGHTLGLRHNFHGSTFLLPEEMINPDIIKSKGLTGSVMDYLAVNLAPELTLPNGETNNYYPEEIGPYDEWAIEYGYTPIIASTPEGEKPFLKAIADRAGEPGLSYATDEDAFDGLDPAANLFDHSKDIINYARTQLENAHLMWRRLESKSPVTNSGYGELRAMFDTVLGYYARNLFNILLHIGGQSFNRAASGNLGSQLPFTPIPVSEQRAALAIVEKYVFAEDAFKFSPDLLNKLAPSRWSHWGAQLTVFPLDYPIGDRLELLQRIVFSFIYDPIRLARIRDAELKATAGNVLALPELFATVQNSVWSEVLPHENKGERNNWQISSIRRSLQREHLAFLTEMVLRQAAVPEDARTLAWYELRQLREALAKTLKKHRKEMDTYSQAHLEETLDRVVKTLNAQLQSN